MISAKLARLAPREQNGMILAGILLSLVAVDWVVIHPILRESERLSGEILAAEKNLLSYREVKMWKPAVEKDFGQVRQMLKKAASQSEAIADMKGEIDDLARKTGVMVSSMEHKEPRVAENHEEYFVDIGKFEADRRAFFAFLGGLQQSPSMLCVAKMSLKPAAAADQVKGSLLITKVMLSEENPAGAPAAGAVESAPAGTR